MIYLIEIQETLSRTVAVEAPSSEEALDKVSTAYHDGKIVLEAEDFLDKSIQDVTTNYANVGSDVFPRLEDYD